MKVLKTTASSRFDRSQFPQWLDSLSDDQLDEYFAEHPTSKYNPANSQGNNQSNDPPADEQTEHSLPLYKRLTFNGWSKSAPTAEIREKSTKFKETVQDLDLDRLDLLDKIADIKDQIAEDKESKAETDSVRRKKRLTKRIFNNREKVSKYRAKLTKFKDRTSTLKKRAKALDKELKGRGDS